MKKKILFISVLTEKNAIITEELGICSIAAYLESKGVEARVLKRTGTFLDFDKIYEFNPDIIGFPVYSTTEKIVVEVCKIMINNPHFINTITSEVFIASEVIFLLQNFGDERHNPHNHLRGINKLKHHNSLFWREVSAVRHC